MLLLPQVYLAARLQLVRPWPEANGKEQSLVTNVRSLGCSENPLETQEHYSFLHQEPCSLGIGMISRPETLLLVFELMRNLKEQPSASGHSCGAKVAVIFSAMATWPGQQWCLLTRRGSSCGLPKITCDFGPV